jgi:ferrous iron transport protein A
MSIIISVYCEGKNLRNSDGKGRVFTSGVLTFISATFHTGATVQLSVNKRGKGPKVHAPRTLAELKMGEQGILDQLDLPEDIARRLMELGFLPGQSVSPARSGPGGEPRVYRVDGSEIALRRETAIRLLLRRPAPAERP